MAKLINFVILSLFILLALRMGVTFFSSERSHGDHFADNLIIPENIEVAEPAPYKSRTMFAKTVNTTDALQSQVRKALSSPGNDISEFQPSIPSLRQAATSHIEAFHNYLESSPDWHVFVEQGNRYAARRWSYDGEPRDTLHGYIAEFNPKSRFQTRCLFCLDRKQWNRYSVQHVEEGNQTVNSQMSLGNDLHESRVMIDCGEVWVEIFEQSSNLERRVTKATIIALEEEFSKFIRGPEAAISDAKARSNDLSSRFASQEGQTFNIRNGMQSGIYEVTYLLNSAEPGSVYLKAFEVTKGTPLSVDTLKRKSETRMSWSTESSERFSAKTGFTIYEGDWGKPYAARFEVWFKPDTGAAERKLADRIFKIEGWQR